MSSYANPYTVVSESAPSERAAFIQKTYLHLAGAIAAFAAISAGLLQIPGVERMASAMTSGYMWLGVLVAFGVVSYVADRWARSTASIATQYVGLGVYVVAQAVLFLPMMVMATRYVPADSNVLGKAALITGLMVAGITATAFITKKDFSFLKGFLVLGGFVALGIIVASLLFKFDLGIVFSGAMILFASVSVLYTTSNIIHHYNPQQYVAASLSLFAGVALLFWYVLRFVMAMASND